MATRLARSVAPPLTKVVTLRTSPFFTPRDSARISAAWQSKATVRLVFKTFLPHTMVGDARQAKSLFVEGVASAAAAACKTAIPMDPPTITPTRHLGPQATQETHPVGFTVDMLCSPAQADCLKATLAEYGGRIPLCREDGGGVTWFAQVLFPAEANGYTTARVQVKTPPHCKASDTALLINAALQQEAGPGGLAMRLEDVTPVASTVPLGR